ncbi:hypothetical protein C0Q70_02437 [Pomacea canaliculata]|uniref:CUB domain-containing protein n=1 Tax=Pomacea canaliculata TaxID=400727 RepID=A0A2T7PPW8_POMCA|nr:hypothetical protein C0Q70_02437 [Pomacea canaliculata]
MYITDYRICSNTQLESELFPNKYVIDEICTTLKPPVSLYNVSKLYVHFKSVTFYPGTGFRLDFTFHALSALPKQLSDGRWNCSVPHWPDFRLHFPCNLVSDCVGGEDEVDCPYTSHVLTTNCYITMASMFFCKFAVSGDDTLPQMPVSLHSQLCIPAWFECDDFWHCADGLDELMCADRSYLQAKRGKPFPALIDIDFDGKLTAVEPLSMTREPLCPETHFQCPGSNFYCFPVYLRCNGVFDCPGKQDETACDTYTCPGYYRCRSSHVCLHPDHVCDGWSQCPEGDDELLCDLSCPDTCVCHGLAFTCRARFAASSYLELRYLDASGSGMTPRDVVNNTMIVYLSFNNCSITVYDDLIFVILLHRYTQLIDLLILY